MSIQIHENIGKFVKNKGVSGTWKVPVIKNTIFDAIF